MKILEIINLFRQNVAIDMKFKPEEGKGFVWELTVLDPIDLYYLPLIKKPRKVIVYGLMYLQFNNNQK